MANLSNINNILRVSSSGVGINKNNTGPSELDIESAGADMIDMTRTGQKTYRFAISGASAFSLFDVAANADRLVIDSSGNTTFANRVSAGESFNSVKDGADTVADGPFFALKNASGTRQYINQLDASNNIDYWYYNGSTWTQTISLLNNGGATFAGAITISKTSSADLRLHSSTYSADFNLISGATGANKFGIYDNNGGAYRLLVDSSGNVGIGTTSPSDYFAQNLVINNTAGGITLVAPTNSNSYLMFADGTTGDDQYRGYLEYTHASDKMILRSGGDMQFSAGGSIERMRIDSSGIVSVTNSADAILKVETSSGTSSSRLFLKSPTREWRIGVNDAFNSGSLFFYNTEANTYPFIINTSGNIGIGTTSPLSPLSIQANSGGSALRFIGRSDGISGIDFFNSAQTVANYFQSNGTWIRSRADGGFHFSKGSTPITTDVDGFTIEGMNVGIGTTSPSQKLDVVGIIKSSGVSNSLMFSDRNTASNTWEWYSSGNNAGLYKNHNVAGTVMTIDSSGNVGIGTDSPDAKVDILGLDLNIGADNGAPTTRTNSTVKVGVITSPHYTTAEENFTGMLLVGNSNVNEVAIGGGTSTYNSASLLTFFTSADSTTVLGTERMRITSGGDVLIRGGVVNSSPNSTNHVLSIKGYQENAGNVFRAGNINICAQSDGAAYGMIGYNQMSTTSTTINYGVSDFSSFIEFHQGRIETYTAPSGTGGQAMTITTGPFVANGGTSWTSGSDINLKENIKPLKNVLDKIKDYRCVEYSLKSDKNKSKKIGFIAQDWENDFSQVIEKDKDENLGIKYTETIPVLLKAIQELKADNDSLKARIETLENN
jgi:hypothetical protein